MQQVRIQCTIRVPDGCDTPAYHEDLKKSFLESFGRKDEWLHISVRGLGTPAWHLQGRAKLEKEVRHRSARQRIRDIFVRCHERLGLNEAVNHAFGKYLETALEVKPDTDPFDGEKRWWRIERGGLAAPEQLLQSAGD